MLRKTAWLLLFAVVSVAPAATSVRADDPASWVLERSLRDYLGRPVRVTDQVAFLWTLQDVRGYIKFDTYRFRCLLPEGMIEAKDLIERTLNARVPVKLLTIDATPVDIDGALYLQVSSVSLPRYPRTGWRVIPWKDDE